MLNSYSSSTKNYNTTEITACSGGIYKTCDDSWFVRFNLKSNLSETLLSENSRAYGAPVVVLQMIICGDMQVIAELIKRDDYDKLSKTPNQPHG